MWTNDTITLIYFLKKFCYSYKQLITSIFSYRITSPLVNRCLNSKMHPSTHGLGRRCPPATKGRAWYPPWWALWAPQPGLKRSPPLSVKTSTASSLFRLLYSSYILQHGKWSYLQMCCPGFKVWLLVAGQRLQCCVCQHRVGAVSLSDIIQLVLYHSGLGLFFFFFFFNVHLMVNRKKNFTLFPIYLVSHHYWFMYPIAFWPHLLLWF